MRQTYDYEGLCQTLDTLALGSLPFKDSFHKQLLVALPLAGSIMGRLSPTALLFGAHSPLIGRTALFSWAKPSVILGFVSTAKSWRFLLL
jgi:hypothetical protein